MRDLPEAEAAYLDLFRSEAGSLRVSRHRDEILRNALLMLSHGRQDFRAAQNRLRAPEETPVR